MKCALIDLDGTLLGMNQNEFVEHYFKGLLSKFSEIDSALFISSLKKGIEAMYANNGIQSNEEKFWEVFCDCIGFEKEYFDKKFEDFYLNDFLKYQQYTYIKKESRILIDVLKEKGYQIVCATNPLFPKIATYTRIKWAGLKIEDFIEITTFENYHYCKPNPLYFKEIIKKNNLDVSNTIMIGNDLFEDTGANSLGIKVYIVNDDLLGDNKEKNYEFIGSMNSLINEIKKHF